MGSIRTIRAVRPSSWKGPALSVTAGSATVALAAALSTSGSPIAAAQPTASASPKESSATAPDASVSLAPPPPSASAAATPTPRPWFKTFVVPPCRPDVFFTIRYQKPVDLFIPRTEYVDGPGGEIDAWIKRFHNVRLHVGLDREIEDDFNIQNFTTKIRKLVGSAIEQDHAIEIGHEFVIKVSPHRYGHLRYRVFGLRLGFDMWRVYHNCGHLRVTSGTAVFPTVKEGWKYWETKSLQHTTGSSAVTSPHRGSPEK